MRHSSHNLDTVFFFAEADRVYAQGTLGAFFWFEADNRKERAGRVVQKAQPAAAADPNAEPEQRTVCRP